MRWVTYQMKTNRILILTENSSLILTTELEQEGYDVLSCSPYEETEVIRICLTYDPGLVVILNVSLDLELSISSEILSSIDTKIVTSGQHPVGQDDILLKFSSILSTNPNAVEALVVNKVKIYLRLLKINELAAALFKISVDI